MSESPAETMRRAAALMRERVQELAPLPWKAEGRDVLATQDYEAGEDGWLPDWGHAFNVAASLRQDEAEHIASWSPPVALAVAEWLEAEAISYDEHERTPYGAEGAAFVAGDFGGDVDPALKLARLYLGEEAP